MVRYLAVRMVVADGQTCPTFMAFNCLTALPLTPKMFAARSYEMESRNCEHFGGEGGVRGSSPFNPHSCRAVPARPAETADSPLTLRGS